MAVQGSGTKGNVSGEKDPTSYNARSGAAKKVQSSVATTWGMKDQTKLSGVTGGIDPNSGVWAHPPDASSPNPLEQEPKSKNLKRQAQILETPWRSMKSPNPGQGLNPNLSGKVLGEAILSGSTKLPAVGSGSSNGPSPRPWPASDPN